MYALYSFQNEVLMMVAIYGSVSTECWTCEYSINMWPEQLVEDKHINNDCKESIN